jgi:hypothetical protein
LQYTLGKIKPEKESDRIFFQSGRELLRRRDALREGRQHGDRGKLLPLCTNEGSGMGGSERDIKKTCPGADVKAGLPITGSQAANSKASVEKWLSANGLL